MSIDGFDKDFIDRLAVRAAQIVHDYSDKHEPGIVVSPNGIRKAVIEHLAVLYAMREVPMTPSYYWGKEDLDKLVLPPTP
jgi:hypothetical protein